MAFKEREFSVKQISDELNIYQNKIKSFLKRINSNQQISEIIIKGRLKKLNDNLKEKIVAYIENDNTLTLHPVKQKIENDENLKISKSTIANILFQEKITLERTTLFLLKELKL